MIGNRLRVAFGRAKGWTGQGLLFLAVAFLVPFPLQAWEPKITCQVEYIEDRLTINAKNATLAELLSSIRKKTGIEFRVGRDQSEKCLTVRLGPLPLLESLKRMLRDFSYTFFFGPDDRLTKVFILDQGEAGIRPPHESVVHSWKHSGVRVNPRESFVSPAREGIMVEMSTRERMASTSFAQDSMVPPTLMPEEIMVKPSVEKMVIEPAIEKGMTVNPPIEPMHIEYHSGVTMPVKINPGGTIFPTPK